MRTLGLWVAIGTLSACGGGHTDRVADGVDDFLSELSRAGCTVLAECPMARDSQAYFQAMAMASPAGCREFVTVLRKSRTDYAGMVAEGAMTFDAAAGVRCLTEFRKHCEEYTFEDLAACRDVFAGTVATDDACRADFECAGDAYCDNWADRSCPGVCGPRLALGGHCNYDAMCSTATGPAACSVGACAPLSYAVAEPSGECGEIGDLEQMALVTCPDGYFCDQPGTFDVTHVCAPRTPRGAACDRSEDLCADNGDACLPSDADENVSVCRPVLVLGPAAACSPALSTSTAVCNALDRFTCVAGACASAGDGRAGSLCGDAVLVGCAEGFGCVDGACRALLEDGAACTDDGQCAGYCDGVCVPGC